ncbi:lipoprotein [Actinoplanes sp. URMC 104]|uniref:lipoprotein n=1 Tax=Actinoplanes sp. URMC 104 TaxID=3423409 RepID=UPI003F1BD52E
MTRRLLPAVLTTAASTMLLAGCSGDPEGPRWSEAPAGTGTTSPAADDPWRTPAPAAAGAKSTACKLPVTFDVAQNWKPTAVDPGLIKQAGFTLRCEIDAKPAQLLGFLRVWTGPGATPAAALEKFLTGKTGVRSRATEAGTRPAAEATYVEEDPELDVRRHERLLAVATAQGVAILVIGGIDAETHRELLPAYELARQSLTVP